jgi:Spy/CpxP family protein refolding chaperone
LLLVGCLTHGGHRCNKERIEKMINWKFDDLLDEIDADQDQRRQLTVIKDRVLGDLKETCAARDGFHQQMLAEFGKENPDSKAVHAAVDQRFDEFKALSVKVTDAMLEVHRILRPEQREILIKRMEEHHRCFTGD